LEIIDNGIGIEPDRQKHLFDLYSEIKEESNSKNHASGMGLASSRILIENLGGETFLKHSEFGLTVFCMKVPIMKSDE
jgi:signal transduction histidine kinase